MGFGQVELVYHVAAVGWAVLSGLSRIEKNHKDEDMLKKKLSGKAMSWLLGVQIAGLALAGCGGGDSGSGTGKREFVTIGSAPVGGAFYAVGGAISDVLNDASETYNWKANNESTGGSMENIRSITTGDLQFAMSNSSITYFASRGEEGWDKAYPVRSVMTLFPNVAMFVTRKDSGITKVSDLKGKRVAVGPEGAGFEYFIRPLLKGHGVSYEDFTDVYAGQQQCVDQLGDGSLDAAFLGGGVPTASIVSASATMDILLVPYGAKEKTNLIETYPFFHPATIKAETYKGQDEVYEGMNVGSAHVIVAENADEDLVYNFTKVVYESRKKIAEKHKAGRAINEKNVIKNTGVDFHPGAVRYYKEIGIWPEGEGQ